MLTLYQVAERLSLHYNTIYHYVRSGELKAIKFDRVYRVREQELEKFIRGKNFKVEGVK